MQNELIVLVFTAASLGFFHTLFGPDHYLPFIVLSKARNWSVLKTTVITALCGIGHILSSVALGFLGIMLGVAVKKLELIESFRGEIAAWFLITFGLVYFAWGLRQAIRNRPHKHLHFHPDGSPHEHKHSHNEEHLHIHESEKLSVTPWVLFIIFIFGPCEPLIPIIMYPAAQGSMYGVFMVTAVFGAITVFTMLSIVLISYFGISFLPVKKLQRYTHALAGAVILLSGITIKFLGL